MSHPEAEFRPIVAPTMPRLAAAGARGQGSRSRVGSGPATCSTQLLSDPCLPRVKSQAAKNSTPACVYARPGMGSAVAGCTTSDGTPRTMRSSPGSTSLCSTVATRLGMPMGLVCGWLPSRVD